MTLGELIRMLESVDPHRKIIGLGEPGSYRGYYEDLAFAPSTSSVPVAEALLRVRGYVGRKFEGYKGGLFEVGLDTPIWSARYGETGLPILGLRLERDPITLICEVQHES